MTVSTLQHSSDKIKLLVIVPRLVAGGGERVVLTVLGSLPTDTWETSVVIVIGGGAWEEFLPEGSQRLYVLESSKPGEKQSPAKVLASMLKRLPLLLRVAKKHDLILACGEFGGPLYLGALLARLTGKPLVGWAHGEVFRMVELSGTGYRQKLHRTLLRWGYNSTRKILAVSNGSAKDLAAGHRDVRKKTCVIYNPVDISIIHIKAAEPVPNDLKDHLNGLPYVIGVGRHEYIKGLDLLVRAHTYLIRTGVNHRLVIVGGEGDATPRLRQLIKDEGVSDSVVLTGYVDNPFPIVKQAAVLALPSRAEGFGLVVVEAMALGVPVVVSDASGGPVEIVDNGKYGVVFPGEDVQALAEALKPFLMSAQYRSRWATLSISRAKQFSIESYMERFEKALMEVLK